MSNTHPYTCPLTVHPGQIVGWVAGRPVYAIAGGSEPDGDTGTDSGGDDAGQGGDDKAGGTGSADAGSGDAKDTGDKPDTGKAGKVEELPDWAQKIIRDARKEAADHRTGKNSAEQKYQGTLDAIAKALGLKEDEKLNPEDLAKQLEERDTQLYRMRVERGMARACRKAGADEDLTTALLAHQGKLDDLDPQAKDFDAKLDALVKGAVDGNQKLKVGQAPPGKSSVDHGPAGDQRTADKPRSLTDAVSAALGT